MSSGSAMAAGTIAVRKLEALEEFDACVALQREIGG